LDCVIASIRTSCRSWWLEAEGAAVNLTVIGGVWAEVSVVTGVFERYTLIKFRAGGKVLAALLDEAVDTDHIRRLAVTRLALYGTIDNVYDVTTVI
jgi:hypothetical protein